MFSCRFKFNGVIGLLSYLIGYCIVFNVGFVFFFFVIIMFGLVLVIWFRMVKFVLLFNKDWFKIMILGVIVFVIMFFNNVFNNLV